MNMDRDQRFPPGPMGNLQQIHQNRPAARRLTQEEIDEWNNCMKAGIFKGGLPFACGMYIFNTFVKKAAPSNAPPVPPILPLFNLKPKLLFVGNFLIGIFLYTPICYNKLVAKYMETEKQLREKEEGAIPTGEKGILQTDDSFRSSLDLNLDVSESSFSHLDMDVDSSVSDKLILEDPQDPKQKKSIPDTTYDDLRRRNRESYTRKITSPAPYVRDDPRQSGYPSPVVQKPPTNEPFPSKGVKNKYGDEIEV